MTPTSRYLPLDHLTSCLSHMPQLKHLDLTFEFYIPSNDVARPINPPNVKQISLSNLTGFFFHGDSSYLEAFAARIAVPHIATLNAGFLNQPSSTLPRLSGLLSTAAGLKFRMALINFSSTDDPMVIIWMASSEQTLGRRRIFPPFRMRFPSSSLYVQVTSTGKICTALTPMLSAVERLYLCFDETRSWSLRSRHIDNARWYDLFRPFCIVKKLHIDGQLWGLSRVLSPNDNGPPLEILPELRKILRPDGARFRDAFDGFIAARRDTGQHIVKRRHVPIRNLDGKGRGEVDEEDGFYTKIDSDSDFDSDSESYSASH